MALGAFDNVQVRFRHRMLCNENRAAVLIRQNRRLISTDLFGNINDLLFVESDQRAEYRKCTDLIGHAKGLHCLGDSSGWTRGLMMASAMGVLMGRKLLEKEN